MNTCTECGASLAHSPSEWFCGDDCQATWMRRGHDVMPLPARPEWRKNRFEPDRPAPTGTAVSWPERRDARDAAVAAGASGYPMLAWPAPPPEPTPTAARETPSDQLPARDKPATTSTTDRPGIIRRIWAATKRSNT